MPKMKNLWLMLQFSSAKIVINRGVFYQNYHQLSQKTANALFIKFWINWTFSKLTKSIWQKTVVMLIYLCIILIFKLCQCYYITLYQYKLHYIVLRQWNLKYVINIICYVTLYYVKSNCVNVLIYVHTCTHALKTTFTNKHVNHYDYHSDSNSSADCRSAQLKIRSKWKFIY